MVLQLLSTSVKRIRKESALGHSRRTSGDLERRVYGSNSNPPKVGYWPMLLKVRQAKPGGVGSHVKENATENF